VEQTFEVYAHKIVSSKYAEMSMSASLFYISYLGEVVIFVS